MGRYANLSGLHDRTIYRLVAGRRSLSGPGTRCAGRGEGSLVGGTPRERAGHCEQSRDAAGQPRAGCRERFSGAWCDARPAAAHRRADRRPYRLLGPLGEGGMGSVWLAERQDGEIQQQVAIKFVGSVYRRAWRDRFLQERQLLASLSHPSIVRVIDAGHMPDGAPYLVMEYIAGRRVDDAAAEMPLRERLQLFLRICDGVAHAHRRLIIHRDLKPSNILVDESGQPKLLDFGIAKLLDASAELTGTVERIMTPGYASPEQARGGVQTTATDIYSLGAVLYKIVTGRVAHSQDDAAGNASGERSTLREFVPPSRLNAAVPVDLDYIVRKALREEAEERYATVEGLASDVQALLDSRPVEARAGDLGTARGNT